jgi:hypothetical protein
MWHAGLRENGAVKSVMGQLGFSAPTGTRAKYHANDTRQDVLNVVPQVVPIEDARSWATPPTLDVEGFCLRPHASRVTDFRDAAEVERVYSGEVRQLLLDETRADEVQVIRAAVLRFGERSPESGTHDNSRPARFVHIDVSDAQVAQLYERSRPQNARPVRRSALYNVWRVLTPPPQDVALAVCDARSVARRDLIEADAVFDKDGAVLFTLQSWLLRYDAAQRWVHFSDMRPDEVLVFKTNDTDPAHAHCVPHGAFDNPDCPAGVPARVSLEMRGLAYWFE